VEPFLQSIFNFFYRVRLTALRAVQEFLSSHGQPHDLIADVCAVVASVGFKEELAKQQGSSSSLSKEAAVVQDADRCATTAQLC
jgi:N-acetylglucosamine kinase-like BadF-type ATPase